MEGFFATLKKEIVHCERYQRRSQSRQIFFEYIEGFCNRVRKHSTLGYKSPIKFEQAVYSESCAYISWAIPSDWCFVARYGRARVPQGVETQARCCHAADGLRADVSVGERLAER
uniref:IS3 family transposase n=1 Tax=Schlesneria paludicola TaxID=360056 RepID=UPI000A02B811